MAYPAPDDYQDWRAYARALIACLQEGEPDPDVFSYASRVPEPPPVTIPPPNPSFPPDGWYPVWYSQAEAEMYLGNVAFTPPVASALFNIDTAQLADAAVSTAKLGNLSVSSSKLADLAVEAAKLADSSVIATKIANLAVGSAAIQALAVGTAHIANAAVLSAKIGDAEIITAKIADLAVNNAKIANLAVTSAKIANLAVGTAHIQNAAITNALIANLAVGTAQIQDAAISNVKVGNVIQSHNWNPTTRQGWYIDKGGFIYGQGINIYDSDGDLIFGAGGSVDWARVTGFGKPQDLATVGAVLGTNLLDSSGIVQGDSALKNAAIIIDGLGRLLNIGTPSVIVDNRALSLVGDTGQLGLMSGGVVTDVVNLTDAGLAAFAYLNSLTASNASTYIQSGAIGTVQIGFAAITTALIADASIISAKIAALAVGTAHIIDLSVTQAKIGYLAVGAAQIQDAAITNAKIENAAITSAKIGDLQVKSANIEDLTVGTRKISYFGTTEVAVFYAEYMGQPLGAANVWYSLVYSSLVARVAITATSPNQQVLITLCMSLYRINSNDDILNFRIYRGDGQILTQQYNGIRVVSGNIPYVFYFLDTNVNEGVNYQYYVQYMPTVTNEIPQFGDTTLTAMLIKR